MYTRKGSFWFWVLPPLAVGLVLCILHFGWWRRFAPSSDASITPSTKQRAQVPPVPSPLPVPEPPLPATEVLEPPVAEMEPLPMAPYSSREEAEGALPSLVGMLSDRPELVSWAANRPLLVRFAHAVDRIAKGQSPRAHVDFLVPDRGFETAIIEGNLVPAPSSFTRYDTVTDVFCSIKSAGAAEIYRRVRPVLETLYTEELGYTEGNFHSLLSRACEHLLQTPLPVAPLRLQTGGKVCYFADSSLEELSPAQKHLLRMGPENASRVQRKLRELATACGVAVQDNQQ